MKNLKSIFTIAILFTLTSCAMKPTANPELVKQDCALTCSSHLAKCSSGFTLFPIIKQAQCNDTYDICIQGCPKKEQTGNNLIKEKIKNLDELLKLKIITNEEYQEKRKVIINSI
jgi:hypothetical protein